MLETLHVRSAICVRLRSGPLGSWIDPFVAALARQGYTAGVQRRHVRAADAFSTWVARHQVTVGAIDAQTVARFASSRRRWPHPSRPRGRQDELVGGVRLFAVFLWKQGVAVRQSCVAPVTAIDQWVDAFTTHLTQVRGASGGTRQIYRRYARALLQTCWPEGRADWSALTAARISDFVRMRADTLGRSSSRTPVTAVRAFVRFLVSVGVVRPGLEGAVPTVRQWKLVALPRTLTAAQVQRVLRALDTTAACGARDHAVLLLLSRLGLRAGDVAALRAAHIDGHRGCVHVPPGKTGRARVLPLAHDVGMAVVDAVRHRPPGYRGDGLFVRMRPPYRPITASTVTEIATRALRRAHIQVPRPGAHAFRHTVATALVHHGVSMKAVADVLGHARLDTTAIYAKLDVDTLVTVAMPWPGGGQ